MLSLLLAGQLVAPPAVPADSVRLRRDARAAQAAFERERRRLLPITTAGLGRCDERVGRFCYWYDEAEPAPPPEPERIVRLRERFLARLDSLAGAGVPDPWLDGQRVRYLVEAGRPDEAVDVARACAAGWRCAAMAGFAFHSGRQFASADSAFEVALAGMPPDLRCRWTDLSLLLEPRDRAGYRRLGCAARDSADAELLWRATPLHANGGRDLRTEILARHALAGMLEGAVTHHGMVPGADYTEMLLRYGWATAYGRRHDPLGPVEEVEVVGHEPKPSYAFLAWTPGQRLDGADRPRFRYAPRYLSQLRDLTDVQVARFRRGDSLLLAVAYAVAGDSLFRGDSARGRVIASGARGEWVASASVSGRTGAALVTARSGDGLVSVELGDSAMRAWRRYRAPVGDLPAGLSDLLVFRADGSDDRSLEGAAARAAGELDFSTADPFGLYWETYRPGSAGGPAPLRLTVIPAGEGVLRRLGRTLGVGADRHRIDLEWVPGLPEEDGVGRHALELDLSRLAPGRYVVEVQTWSETGMPVASRREIRLRRTR